MRTVSIVVSVNMESGVSQGRKSMTPLLGKNYGEDKIHGRRMLLIIAPITNASGGSFG